MITDVDGIAVGHWTDEDALTGCTVVLFPEDTIASGEVRGGAPATREFALLDPTRMIERIDAVALCGGSAFGLAACDGVMSWCEEQGRGFETVAGPVPIVVGMSIFDLAVGDPSVRPDAAAGRAAAAAASTGRVETGLVGVGIGATTAKWRGPDHRRRGGLVTASIGHEDLRVGVLIAVNAFGEIGAQPADVVAGTTAGAFMNTTVGVIATNAALTKTECLLVAQSAHDGLARAVAPAHTRADGDAFVAAATGAIDAPADRVRLLAVHAVEHAITSLRPEE